MRTSSLNDGVSRPIEAARSGARTKGRSAINRSVGRVHGPQARRVQPVQPRPERGDGRVVERGVLAERDPWVVARHVEPDAVAVALGLGGQHRQDLVPGHARPPRVGLGDVLGLDPVDGVDREHPDRRPQRASGLDGGPALTAERGIDFARRDAP